MPNRDCIFQDRAVVSFTLAFNHSACNAPSSSYRKYLWKQDNYEMI